MMPSLFTSLLIFACPLLSFANSDEDSFSRGLIIAVDTRDHQACESSRTRVAGLTSANISNICAQDGRNPISVVVITKSISEFDYLADVVSEDPKRPVLASINHPTLGVMFFLPRSEQNNQYFKLLSQREKTNITIFRQSDFGGMHVRGDRVLTISFMLRATPHQNEVKDEKIVSSVGRRLVFNKGELESLSRSQAKSIINAAVGIVDTVNGALEKGAQESTSVEIFRPKCDPETVCAESKGLTLGVSFIFRF